MKSRCFVFLFIVSTCVAVRCLAQPTHSPPLLQPVSRSPVPYPTALEKAAITVRDMGNISTNGLLLGNGELNAIVYSSGSSLHLRLSKNDCWDMRVNTATDPPLPTIRVEEGTFSRPEKSSSWNDYSYPTALPCADVILTGSDEKTALKSATINLLKARADLALHEGAESIRVLWQRNVILIESDRTISLAGINQVVQENTGNRDARSGKSIAGWVNDATTGSQDRYSYLHQVIPGDADVSGMNVYVVTARRGKTQAIAVVTSRESKHPFEDAKKMVALTLDESTVVPVHEAAWQNFWSKSGVQLSDTTLQNWWYRMIYFNRCFAKGGGNAIGLQAAFDQLGGWHNSLKINYNSQQTYLAAAPANHAELIEPFIAVLTRNLNRGKWFAATSFPGSEGAFFHSDIWPFEPDPATSTTRNKHQLAYLPWGYSWGMAGHAAAVLWEYYTYNPTTAALNRIYPVLSQFALFYCSLLETCSLENGKRKIGPSYFPENGSFGQYNVSYDITFMNSCLKSALKAATTKGDRSLAKRIRVLLPQMPTYSTVVDPAQGEPVVEEWLGAGLQKADNHGTLAQAVFPAEEINWFSSPSQKKLYQRTLAWVETATGHVNSTVTLNIARARLGLGDEAIAQAHKLFDKNSPYCDEQPNGLFYWKNHGYYVTEQVGIARLVTELLLQSAGGALRLFPAWPANQDASFSQLGAQGGFLVSASQQFGKVNQVSILSRVGNPVRIVNPWNDRSILVVEQATKRKIPVSASGSIVSFPTKAGRTYSISPATGALR